MPTPTGLLTLPVVIPNRAIEILCQRHHIRKLALFGFVLRPDFHRNSDVDRTFGVSSSLINNSCYPDQIIVLDILDHGSSSDNFCSTAPIILSEIF